MDLEAYSTRLSAVKHVLSFTVDASLFSLPGAQVIKQEGRVPPDQPHAVEPFSASSFGLSKEDRA